MIKFQSGENAMVSANKFNTGRSYWKISGTKAIFLKDTINNKYKACKQYLPRMHLDFCKILKL